MLRRVFVISILACVGACLASVGYGGEDSPAHIFFNCKVFTGNAEHPYASAVAIQGAKIIAVGNLSEVAKAVPANAERMDLEGKSLFPGFIDAHSHSIDGGISLISADASGKITKLEELP